MKVSQGKWALAMIVAGSVALGGCFGPFKKKSGGGGGGGSETTEEEGGKEGKPGKDTDSGETPSDSGTSTPPPPGAKDGYGCLQGVVTDGYTGQRLDLGTGGKMFVLIRGQMIKATTVKGDSDVADAHLKGEYFICDIPVEETYPVYAYVDGYLPFESSVKITSTRPKRVEAGGQAVVEEVKIPDPIALKDIRLFPVGNTTRDLRVRVVHNGAPVKDAFVDLEPLADGAKGTFEFEGTFINSAGTRILPQRATTGDDGYATFEAANLSLGAQYTVKVHPPVGSNLTHPAISTFVLGVSGATTSDLNTYDMNDDNQPLKAISCSTNFTSFDSAGSLRIMFNREVTVIDPDFLDTAVAVTANIVGKNHDPLELAAVVNDNNTAETVKYSVSGNILTLTPKFEGDDTIKPLEAADPSSTLNAKNKDATATWSLSKVKVKVKDDLDQNNVAVSTLVTTNGAGATLACPLAVRFFQQID
jgi:hypothetical protein